jgi:uncharacterized protein YegJ (DUF2314 family)
MRFIFWLACVVGPMRKLEMKSLFNSLTSGWNFAALLLGLSAWIWYLQARITKSPLIWGIFAFFCIVILGLVMRKQWARKLGLALILWVIASKVYGLVFHKFISNQLIYAVSLGFIGYGLWKKPDNGLIDDFTEDSTDDDNRDSASDNEPMISLVHLRSQQRYLEQAVLANALSEAWGLSIGSEEGDLENADGFVTGENPTFIVVVNKPTLAVFIVHNRAINYFDDAHEIAAKVPNLRFAEIIREHSAWLAVDLIQAGKSKVDEQEAYRLIGKAICSLADNDVMAIFCPQNHFFNLWSDTLEGILCGPTPLDALREEVKAPVIGVPDGSTIENAIGEARNRWQEFVILFQSRKPDDDRFLVKAPFLGENGQVEHMWLQVFGLEPEYVHGHLLNDPMHTTKLKKGAQVEVAVAEISDWICADAEDNPLGNFTHLALKNAMETKHSA